MKLINPSQVEQFDFRKTIHTGETVEKFLTECDIYPRDKFTFPIGIYDDSDINEYLDSESRLVNLMVIDGDLYFKPFIEIEMKNDKRYEKYFTTDEEMFEFKEGLMSGEIKWIEL